MGLIFGRDKVDQKLSELHVTLSDSFAKVKQDSALMSRWVEYLYHVAIEQQRALNDLRSRNVQLQSLVIDGQRLNRHQAECIHDLHVQVKNMPSTKEDIRHIVDSFYSFEPIMARVKQVEQKLAEIGVKNAASLESPVLPSVGRPSASLREKILRRITRNSKDFIKSSIVSLIAKYGKISGVQLREIVVEEQGLCSKSSFYRLLEEVAQAENVQVVIDGKEKIYWSKTPVHSLRSENTK